MPFCDVAEVSYSEPEKPGDELPVDPSETRDESAWCVADVGAMDKGACESDDRASNPDDDYIQVKEKRVVTRIQSSRKRNNNARPRSQWNREWVMKGRRARPCKCRGISGNKETCRVIHRRRLLMGLMGVHRRQVV